MKVMTINLHGFISSQCCGYGGDRSAGYAMFVDMQHSICTGTSDVGTLNER